MPDRWAIGWTDTPLGDWLAGRPPEVDWLHPPPGRFYADPFALEWQGRTIVLFEDYDGESERGHIAAWESGQSVRPVLRQPFHLSYPCLLEWQGEVFCVPEQHQANQVTLYRACPFPDRWHPEAVLLSDFPGVDPTVFEHGGQWWMWVGRQDDNARSRLYLFTAPCPTGPWLACGPQPCMERDRLARCAGLPLKESGRLLRPAQNRHRTYGGSLVLYAVESLSRAGYSEMEVARLEPPGYWPYPDGLHHLSRPGARTFFDAKRVVASLMRS